jgi:hypothetical protein
MRKLLYLAAGVVLLSAPAAFAQNDAAPGDQPASAAAADGQMGSTDPQQDAVSGPSQVAPEQAGAADQGAAPVGAYDQSQYQGPAYSSPTQPPPGYYGGSRLYVQQGESQGQSVQIISNAPVPDTIAVRRRFPPLSRAGRRTAPAGN